MVVAVATAVLAEVSNGVTHNEDCAEFDEID